MCHGYFVCVNVCVVVDSETVVYTYIGMFVCECVNWWLLVCIDPAWIVYRDADQFSFKCE